MSSSSSSLISELGLIDPIVVSLLRKENNNKKKNTQASKSQGQKTKEKSKRWTLRTVALVVLGAIRLARGATGHRRATEWNQRMKADESCWYVVSGIGRMRMSSSYLASSIAQDRNTRSRDGSDGKNGSDGSGSSSPVRTSPDVSRSLSSLVSLFSQPNVGGYITSTNTSASSIHDDVGLTASDYVFQQNELEQQQQRRPSNEDSRGSRGSRGNLRRGRATTTADIFKALVENTEGNQSKTTTPKQPVAATTSYQTVLIRRAMLKLIQGYISATKQVHQKTEHLKTTTALLSMATKKHDDTEHQRARLQHRCEAYENRLRTFIIEECDLVEHNESTVLTSNETSVLSLSAHTADAHTAAAQKKKDHPPPEESTLDQTLEATLSKYSTHKYVRLSTTLYNDIRRERDHWKGMHEKLSNNHETQMNAYKKEHTTLSVRLQISAEELKDCQDEVAMQEQTSSKKFAKLKTHLNKKIQECTALETVVDTLSDTLNTVEGSLKKEKKAREHLSTEGKNIALMSFCMFEKSFFLT